MRNLKKILALVLALVMSMSVLTVANASFSDADELNEKYATAVETLAALEVFKGYTDGSFNPKGSITRAEVAAIIYRIDTKDIKDQNVKVYSDYNKFEDVSETAWYAGYVNYCANALYVRGTSDTTFNPNGNVTGYQVLAMILRVVGYDKNGEFSGNEWQLETASTAQSLGITKNISSETLGKDATRELVAELLYRTIMTVPQVTYTLAFGYNQYQELVDRETLNPTINEAKIGLGYKTLADDIWGRPGATQWVASKWDQKKVLATYPATPVFETTDPITECDLSAELGFEVVTEVQTYVNGVAGTADIHPLNTNPNYAKHVMGEQGTIFEVYVVGYDAYEAPIYRVVMIDTYLAVVNDLVKEKVDKNGHTYVYPTNGVYVYAHEDLLGNANQFTIAGNNYAIGDYLMVYVNESTNAKVRGLYIQDFAPEMTGAQTKLWYYADQHTIEGKLSLDNVNYVLDDAKFDKDTEYRWFFDANGYVLGSALIPEFFAAKYAVVMGAQWINTIGENGYCLGQIQYLDGSAVETAILYGIYVESEGKVIEFNYDDAGEATFENGTVCTTYQYNQTNSKTWDHLYEVVETAKGLVLYHVGAYDADTGVMTAKDEITGVTVLKKGVPEVVADFYQDNTTKYFFYNAKTKSLDVIEGYTNLAKQTSCNNIDFVYNANGFAAQFIYVPSTNAPGTADPVYTYGFYFMTDDAFSYELADKFALLGLIDVEGATDPLFFAPDWKGTEAATEYELDTIVENGENTLFFVIFKNGMVDTMTAIDNEFDGTAFEIGQAVKVAADKYEFIRTGVLKLEDVALNVTENTVIINEYGKAIETSDMVNVEGNALYIVYAGTTAVAIFVIPTPIPGATP